MDKALKFTILFILLIGGYWILPLLSPLSSASSSEPQILEEEVRPEYSRDTSWWVASGGMMIESEKGWKTIEGELPMEHEWRRHYLRENPMDTDNGYHPQNIFRLLSRRNFSEPEEELVFEISDINMSESPNRNSSAGVFLYARYINAQNYYYAGLQADGKAVIRKKYAGTFATLGEARVWNGEYDRDANPLLLPTREPLGLRVSLEERDNMLGITLELKKDSGEWIEIARALDSGLQHGEILPEGRVGIRTDFLDVAFRSYLVRE